MTITRTGRSHLIYTILFYVLIALLFTYPLVPQITSHLAGVPGQDAMQHLWISWWTQHALIDLGVSPMEAGWLYYPDGAIHQMLWVTPYPHIAGLPLVLLFGPVPAYNFHLLLSFVLSALTAYLLVLYLTRNRAAALLGGLVFAIFPNRMAQSTAHFAQVVTYLFPLCALYLIKLKRQPNRHNAIVFGVLLGLSLLVNIVHIAYLLLPLLVVFIGYWAIFDRSDFWTGRTLRYLALGLLIGVLISGPFLLPFVWHAFTGQLDYLQQGGVTDFSADLLAFFVPAMSHPILSQWPAFREFATKLVGAGNFRENTVYLGIIPLIIAAYGVWRCKKARTWPWLILTFGAAILSMGPVLKVAGHVTGLPLPYAAIQYLPFYKWGRIPGRFNETVILGLAVLTGYGYAALSRKLRAKARTLFALTVILFVFIGLEYWTLWPYPTMSAAAPEFYDDWAMETDDFAVLDLPQWPLWVREASNHAMLYQTTHEHRIVGGYVWRLPRQRSGTMKAFQELLWPDGQTDIIARRRGVGAVPLLNQYDIRYVVVHGKTLPPEDEANDIATVSRALGDPLYAGPETVAFAVPEAPPPDPMEPLTAFSYNWYLVEPVDGRPARWLKNDGTLHMHWLEEPETSYRLTFAVSSFKNPRHLQVSVNGQDLEEMSIDEPQTVELSPLVLRKGQNDIHFYVPEGCDVPAETAPGSADLRCLSLLFQDMELSPVQGEAP
jgi:hypothetical protein